MPEALCFLCFLSIVYLQTYPSVRYRGVLPAGVAYATPATAYTVWVASLTVPAVVCEFTPPYSYQDTAPRNLYLRFHIILRLRYQIQIHVVYAETNSYPPQ